MLTRTDTPDGVAHFKLSIQNPKGTNLKTVALHAGDKKLIEWPQPPYAIDIPLAKLAGLEFVRASVIDSTGYEAADLLFLHGDRYIEQVDVHLIELPVSVTEATGAAILGLLVIVDHGGGYLSLYGHNEALLKESGDWVEPGEAIARAKVTPLVSDRAMAVTTHTRFIVALWPPSSPHSTHSTRP